MSVALAFLAFSPPILAAQDESLVDEEIEAVEALAGEEEESAEEEQEQKPTGHGWHNIVPIPVIITEPAIGQGLGVAVGYFHPLKSGAGHQEFNKLETPQNVGDMTQKRKPPATISGAFAAYTNNGTGIAGVGHIDSFRNDTIRYMGAAALANVIADFYILDQPFEFKLEGLLIYQDVKFRFGESDVFWGVGFSYLDATNTFRVDPPDEGPPADLFASDIRDVGVSGRIMYDTRDDTLMPSTGQLFDFSVWHYDEAIGGDFNYSKLKAKFLTFHQLNEKIVLGWRIEADAVGGNPPFYGIPWVTLRGIPAMRFQGDEVLVTEFELRYNFTEKWAAIGFVGKGWTQSDIAGIETEETIRAWGVGGRYRLLRDQNVWVGIDAARGPEDTAWYIQVGHAW